MRELISCDRSPGSLFRPAFGRHSGTVSPRDAAPTPSRANRKRQGTPTVIQSLHRDEARKESLVAELAQLQALTTPLSLDGRRITKRLRDALGNHPALLGRHVQARVMKDKWVEDSFRWPQLRKTDKEASGTHRLGNHWRCLSASAISTKRKRARGSTEEKHLRVDDSFRQHQCERSRRHAQARFGARTTEQLV